jgi:hypothetical protein
VHGWGLHSRPQSSAVDDSSQSAFAPLGSCTNPRQLHCRQGLSMDSASPGSHDLVVGPLRYPRLLLGFADEPPITEPNCYGGYFYKVGVELSPAKVATVMIGGRAYEYASLISMYSPHTGDEAITYHSCKNAKFGTAWVGGFLLRGRKTGCVPLRISIADGESRREVVSLGAGECRGS